MIRFTKTIIFSATLLTGAAAVANAQTTILPDVVVRGGPTPNPGHYRVPAGYDADVALHPYTSGIGPCTEGASPSQGCHHATGNPIAPSHYEQPAFTR
jgi:hypothetical protein